MNFENLSYLILLVNKFFMNLEIFIALGSFIISVLAFIVSIFNIKGAKEESILSNRAYIYPVTWNTVDDKLGKQFQFQFRNSGNTPATCFKVSTQWIFDDQKSQVKILADNIVLLHGLESNLNPKVPLTITDDNKIQSSKVVKVKLLFEYRDYVKQLHKSTTDFLLHKINDSYQLTLLRSEIYF